VPTQLQRHISRFQQKATEAAADLVSAATPPMPGSVTLAEVKADVDIADALTRKHDQEHDIVSTDDHTSTATSEQILKADANGLPVDASNTDTEVADAVSLKHTQGTDTALGAVGTKNPPIDADLALYRDSTAANVLVTSTWTQVKAFLKTYFDTLYVTVTGRYRFASTLADDATQALPTVTANYPSHGFVQVTTTSAIVESAEFEMGSDGTVNLIRATANVVTNADTDTKFCLGTAAGQNPLTVKNRLGGIRQVLITFWYA